MNQSEWTTIISSKSKLFSFNIDEVWRYRDLLWLFVKRDISVVYKQTILGPLWFIIRPMATTLMFTFVFGKLANIQTDGIPHIIFYLLGVTIWGYFAECLNKTSSIFVSNQDIFGKVYFPRIIVPVSTIISNLGKLFIQLIIFIGIWCYYIQKGSVAPNFEYIIILPYVVFVLAIVSLGFGMIFSSLTTKYRDLVFLLSFGVQLWMYVTPVIYPVSTIPEKFKQLVMLNPVAPLIESMRYAFLGKGYFSFSDIIYSSVFAGSIFFVGYLIFTKVEKKFMDTV